MGDPEIQKLTGTFGKKLLFLSLSTEEEHKNSYDKALASPNSKVKIEKEGDHLSINSVDSIYDAVFRASLSNYIEMALANREGIIHNLFSFLRKEAGSR
jgi:hypothetical protein